MITLVLAQNQNQFDYYLIDNIDRLDWKDYRYIDKETDIEGYGTVRPINILFLFGHQIHPRWEVILKGLKRSFYVW